jgi:Protein of unknown function (DUF1264)
MKIPMGYGVLPLAMLAACGGDNTGSNVTAPGADESAKTKTLEAGANLLQGKAPLNALNAYLDGFHFYSGDPQAQMEAHHYCGHLSEDMIQCVIFDGNEANAKLMGVEYIVSRTLFEQLPTDEKHLWHSHVHEVRAGTLIAPGIPDVAEHELMEKLAGTYGKTWHTWHTDQKLQLPTGAPTLMMGFVDGHPADPARVADRDQRFNVSSERKREQRSDIQYPPIDPEADAWQKGIVPQLQLQLKMTSESGSAKSPL